MHLTLNAEYDLYRWGPITQAPSLLDGDGGFPRTVEDVWDHADLDEVRRELRAQVERAILWGFDVTHLDSHMGTLQLRPEFFDIYLDLAVEFGLPLRLSGASTERMVGFPFRKLADEEGVRVPRPLRARRPGSAAAASIERVVGDLRPGVTEVYVHPAVDTPELRAFAPDWAARVDDHQLVTTDSELAVALQRAGVHLIGFRRLRDLQRAAYLAVSEVRLIRVWKTRDIRASARLGVEGDRADPADLGLGVAAGPQLGAQAGHHGRADAAPPARPGRCRCGPIHPARLTEWQPNPTAAPSAANAPTHPPWSMARSTSARHHGHSRSTSAPTAAGRRRHGRPHVDARRARQPAGRSGTPCPAPRRRRRSPRSREGRAPRWRARARRARGSTAPRRRPATSVAPRSASQSSAACRSGPTVPPALVRPGPRRAAAGTRPSPAAPPPTTPRSSPSTTDGSGSVQRQASSSAADRCSSGRAASVSATRSATRSAPQSSGRSVLGLLGHLGLDVLVLLALGERHEGHELAHVPRHLHLPLHERGVGVELALQHLDRVVVGAGQRELGVGSSPRVFSTILPLSITVKYFTSPSGAPVTTYCIRAVAPGRSGNSCASSRWRSSHSWVRYFAIALLRSGAVGGARGERTSHADLYPGEEVVLGVGAGTSLRARMKSSCGYTPAATSSGSPNQNGEVGSIWVAWALSAPARTSYSPVTSMWVVRRWSCEGRSNQRFVEGRLEALLEEGLVHRLHPGPRPADQ